MKFASDRTSDELAFLPAALEIVETPASPLVVTTIGTIIAFFCLALGWSFLADIDVVVLAHGKILRAGGTRVIRASEVGAVRAIHARDGQHVKVGDLLIELDPTINDAEGLRLQDDIDVAELDIARLAAALSDDVDPIAAFRTPEGRSSELIAMERQLLILQVEENRAKLALLDHQRAQKEAELTTITAKVKKLEAALSVLQQRIDIFQPMHSQETDSNASYLEILQLLVDTQQELVVKTANLARLRQLWPALTKRGHNPSPTSVGLLLTK
jgi:hemolysin D